MSDIRHPFIDNNKTDNRGKKAGLNNLLKSSTSGRMSPVFLIIILVLAVSFLTRLALLIKTGKSFDWSFKNITGSFFIGAFFDLAMSLYLVVPFVLQLWWSNEKMYRSKWK